MKAKKFELFTHSAYTSKPVAFSTSAERGIFTENLLQEPRDSPLTLRALPSPIIPDKLMVESTTPEVAVYFSIPELKLSNVVRCILSDDSAPRISPEPFSPHTAKAEGKTPIIIKHANKVAKIFFFMVLISFLYLKKFTKCHVFSKIISLVPYKLLR